MAKVINILNASGIHLVRYITRQLVENLNSNVLATSKSHSILLHYSVADTAECSDLFIIENMQKVAVRVCHMRAQLSIGGRINRTATKKTVSAELLNLTYF